MDPRKIYIRNIIHPANSIGETMAKKGMRGNKKQQIPKYTLEQIASMTPPEILELNNNPNQTLNLKIEAELIVRDPKGNIKQQVVL